MDPTRAAGYGLMIVAVLVTWPALAVGAEEPVNRLSAEETSAGWRLLFDGATLTGWRTAPTVDWRVVEGAIVATSGEISLLCSAEVYQDFELALEFRAGIGTNSGVFLRTPCVCSDPATACYELNIAPPDNPFPTGSLVRRAKVEGAGERDDWRRYRVRVEGGRIVVWLDGEEVLDFVDHQPLVSGHVGMQHNSGPIAFRNVKLRPLD